MTNIELKRLTKSGSVQYGGIVIQSYPKLEPFPLENDVPVITKEIVAQEKTNGANIRVFYDKYNNCIICLTRGGFREQSTEQALISVYGDNITRFFNEYPDLVLCGEIIGRNTIANLNAEYYAKHYGTPTIFTIFDIFEVGEKGRWLNTQEVSDICKKFNLHQVPLLGVYSAGEGQKLLRDMQKIAPVNEGVVIKGHTERNRDTIWKLRFEYFKNHFQDRVVLAKKEKVVSEESIIFSHFIQGYPQPELRLNEGISPKEKEIYDKKINELREVVRTDRQLISKKVAEISGWLTDIISHKGTFSDEQLSNIHKIIRQHLGKIVSNAIAQR